MNEQGFVTKRAADWHRLSELSERASTRISDLSTAELKEFVRLYRRASTDLAVIRTRTTNGPLTDSLNDTVARAYAILYAAPRKSFWRMILDVLAVSAQTVRRRRHFVYVSLGIFLLSAFGTYGLLSADPKVTEFFIPKAYKDTFDEWKSGKFPGRTSSESAGATGFYISNNPRVAIISGAVGAGTFGILPVLLIYQNGSMVGALAHEVASVGKLDFLLTSITPHGVPEIGGLIMSGAAGLLLGFALINPGQRTRAESLRAVGTDAITLLAISVIMTFMAAPIEGYFSFNPLVPGFAKVTVTVISLTAWLSFWAFYAKEAPDDAVTSDTQASGA
jgi:uncharacterized membrane protein SpoIIM required for sporulation